MSADNSVVKIDNRYDLVVC